MGTAELLSLLITQQRNFLTDCYVLSCCGSFVVSAIELHTGAFPQSRWQGQFWSPGKQKDDFLSIDELRINASPNPFCLYQLMEEWPFAEVAELWSLQWYGALWGDVKTCRTKLGKTLMFSEWSSVGWGSKQQSVQSYTAIHGEATSSSGNRLLTGNISPHRFYLPPLPFDTVPQLIFLWLCNIS